MKRLIPKVSELLLVGDRKGVTAVEYGILAALIALVIIGAIQLLGTNLEGVFSDVNTAINPPAG